LTLAFNSDDSMTVAFVQDWDRHAGEFGGSVGEFVVTGGTGRFAGANGGGNIAALYMDRQAADVIIVLEGTIVLP
jgi:hypothetical protein